MTDMPPPRFRVIERGRRLEVIDTRTGQPVARQPEKPTSPKTAETPRSRLPQKIRFDGGAVWTTHRLYDAKGPRRLTLDAGSVQQLQMAGAGLVVGAVLWAGLALFFPPLWVLPTILASGKSRAALRGAVTAWLDRIEAAGS